MLITSVLETCVHFLSYHQDCLQSLQFTTDLPFIAPVGLVIVQKTLVGSLRWLDTAKRGLPSFFINSDHIAYIRYGLCQIDNSLRL